LRDLGLTKNAGNNLRQVAEIICTHVQQRHNIWLERNDQANRIIALRQANVITQDQFIVLNHHRDLGNIASHPGKKLSLDQLQEMFTIADIIIDWWNLNYASASRGEDAYSSSVGSDNIIHFRGAERTSRPTTGRSLNNTSVSIRAKVVFALIGCFVVFVVVSNIASSIPNTGSTHTNGGALAPPSPQLHFDPQPTAARFAPPPSAPPPPPIIQIRGVGAVVPLSPGVRYGLDMVAGVTWFSVLSGAVIVSQPNGHIDIGCTRIPFSSRVSVRGPLAARTSPPAMDNPPRYKSPVSMESTCRK
jgi:hypothetical protein